MCFEIYTKHDLLEELQEKKCHYIAGKASCKFKGYFHKKGSERCAPKKCQGGETLTTLPKNKEATTERKRKEKRKREREGVSNTYYKYLASLSVTEKQYGNLTNAPSKEELQNLRKQDSDEVFAGHKSPYIKLF